MIDILRMIIGKWADVPSSCSTRLLKRVTLPKHFQMKRKLSVELFMYIINDTQEVVNTAR